MTSATTPRRWAGERSKDAWSADAVWEWQDSLRVTLEDIVADTTDALLADWNNGLDAPVSSAFRPWFQLDLSICRCFQLDLQCLSSVLRAAMVVGVARVLSWQDSSLPPSSRLLSVSLPRVSARRRWQEVRMPQSSHVVSRPWKRSVRASFFVATPLLQPARAASAPTFDACALERQELKTQFTLEIRQALPRPCLFSLV